MAPDIFEMASLMPSKLKSTELTFPRHVGAYKMIFLLVSKPQFSNRLYTTAVLEFKIVSILGYPNSRIFP